MKLKFIVILVTILSFISGCVQKSHQKIVLVKLDMRAVDNPANVGIRGQFPLSWEQTEFLKDKDGDGIYEGEYEFYTAVNQIEFKFVNQNDQFELEDQPNRHNFFVVGPKQDGSSFSYGFPMMPNAKANEN